MDKDKVLKHEAPMEAIPVEEIAQLIVSRAYSRIKNIQMVVDSMGDVMAILSEKCPGMSEVLLKIKDEIKKYKA